MFTSDRSNVTKDRYSSVAAATNAEQFNTHCDSCAWIKHDFYQILLSKHRSRVASVHVIFPQVFPLRGWNSLHLFDGLHSCGTYGSTKLRIQLETKWHILTSNANYNQLKYSRVSSTMQKRIPIWITPHIGDSKHESFQ